MQQTCICALSDYYPALGFQIYFGYELKFSKHYALNIGIKGRVVKFNSTTLMTETQSIFYKDFNNLDGNGVDYYLRLIKYFGR